jgi:hypothetical protein
MLNCKRAVLLISQGMDKKLGILQRINLRFHLMRCGGCKDFRKQMMFLRKGCQNLSQCNPDIKD